MKIMPLVFGIMSLLTGKTFCQIIRVDLKTIQQTDARLDETLNRRFRSYKTVAFDIGRLKKYLSTDTESIRRFAFRDGSTEMIFTLSPHDLRHPQYRSDRAGANAQPSSTSANTKWYKGYVGDRDQDITRLAMNDDGIEGYFYNNGKLTFIEPLKKYAAGQSSIGRHIIYSADNIVNVLSVCGLTGTGMKQANVSAMGRSSNTAQTPPRLIQIATDATHSYRTEYGAGTNDHILTVLNMVEGLYERKLGITFLVTYQHYFETPADPYDVDGAADDGLALLNQFQKYWNKNWNAVPRDLAFLFDWRILPSGTLGRAFQAQACEDVNFAYGFMALTTGAYETMIVAHELGHLLGAVHESVSACSANPSLMCSSVQPDGPFEFSEKAKADIAAFLQQRDCNEKKLAVDIYPVPARAAFNIVTSGQVFSIALYNAMGRQVFFETYTEYFAVIPVQHIPPGAYWACIRSGNQIVTRRVEVVQ